MFEGEPSTAVSKTAAAAGRAGEEMAFSAVGRADRWRRGRLTVASAAA